MPDPIIEVTAPEADIPQIKRLVMQTFTSEGRSLARVEITFTDAAAIQVLNREHRGKDTPTDVLSFPFDDSFPHGGGGEVIVCPEQADHSQERILDRLVVHGVLHLLGYEDETDAGLDDMERRTDTIVEKVHG